MTNDNGEFKEYRKMLLAELERLNKVYVSLDSKLGTTRDELHRRINELENRLSILVNKFERELRSKISDNNIEIVTLKTKASMWGFVAGAIPAAIGIIVSIITLIVSING